MPNIFVIMCSPTSPLWVRTGGNKHAFQLQLCRPHSFIIIPSPGAFTGHRAWRRRALGVAVRGTGHGGARP